MSQAEWKRPGPQAMTKWELVVLSKMIEWKSIKTFVEIGSRAGGSLLWIGERMPAGGRVISVDLPGGPWGVPQSGKSLAKVAAHLRHKCRHNVSVLLGNSQEGEMLDKVRAELDGQPIDLLFVDADHSLAGVARDIQLYSKLVRKDGQVLMHDCGDLTLGANEIQDRPPEKVRERLQTNYDCHAAFRSLAYGRRSLLIQEWAGLGLVWM